MLNAWATTKLVEGLIPGREETQLVASIAALLINKRSESLESI